MKTTVSRRAALAGALPALVAASLPAMSAMPSLAAAAHPDAALFALKPRIDAMDAAARAATTDDEFDAAGEPYCELREQICSIRATTLAGLQFKARFCDGDPEVMQSIVDDLLAIRVQS